MTILFLFCLVINANCQNDSINNSGSAQIDPLIEKQILDKNCILIRFGADAVTAVNTEKGIVVIDAGISTELSGRYRKIIENEFNDSSFIYVIITHGHYDHATGAGVFPEAGIVCHNDCFPELLKEGKNAQKRIENLKKIVEQYDLQLNSTKPGSKEWKEVFTQKYRYFYALNDSANPKQVNLPLLRFEDSQRIDLGDSSIELFFFGRSHSESDILIFFPNIKLLFTGDIFTRYGRPGFEVSGGKDKKRWLKAIKWVRSRRQNIEKIIDGHGEILSIDDFNTFDDLIEK